MKRTITTLAALALLVSLTGPAGAVKPPGKGKSQLEVTKVANPSWAIHAEGDVITYTVTISNLGPEAVSPVSVSDSLIPLAFVGGDDGDEALDPNESWVYQGTLTVTDLTLEEITNTVAVQAGDLTASASATVNVIPYLSCGFTYDASGTGTMLVTGEPKNYTFCVWDPPAIGQWRLAGVSAGAHRTTNAGMIVRDYLPGNWCGGAADRLRAGEELTASVTLPEDGTCPGDQIGDGNPKTFYLATQGLSTVTATPTS
ncbi:MAG: hypothetical protein HKO63_09915 [Acidimicrobiia bacterium]|nr:DUF11 domain-containing protein [Acidimicrobiia bacterium]NNL98506.1 hypothetical protein [Acidimicrobiia bacterium]